MVVVQGLGFCHSHGKPELNSRNIALALPVPALAVEGISGGEPVTGRSLSFFIYLFVSIHFFNT